MMQSNEQLSALLTEHIDAGEFPSAVYLVGEGEQIVFADALGHSVVQPYRIANKLDTMYDLASLTKPLVTGMLCARRIELGELTLDSSVLHYLPEFERADRQMITVRELLTHTSGLPAWRPLYLLAEDEPERTAGAIAQLEIFEPLQLKQTFFNPELALQTGIAACELGNSYEKNMCNETGAGEYGNSRRRQIWGEVHDGNAYFLGGAAGHAGLFSTASEVFRMAQQFIGELSRLLIPQTCKLFRQNMTEGLEEARSLAWQLAATKDSTAGTDLAPDSFGHNGFTGTSLWIDAEHQRIFVLLTNRTHARELPFANINAVRRLFNSLAIAEIANQSRSHSDPPAR